MSFFVSPKNTTRAQNMTQTTQTIIWDQEHNTKSKKQQH